MRTRIVVGIVLSLVVGTVGATSAHADEVIPDAEVAYALAAEPGGYATGAHTAYWPGSGMTLQSSEAFSIQSVGSCATGAICAYNGLALTGAKLSWTTCGTFSTSALATVKSIANARSSGTLRARNGTTVLATATAGKQANVAGTVTNVQCS